MAGEDESAYQGNPPEGSDEFLRMMDARGREGPGRMIERLTRKIDENPQDAESQHLRGQLYGQLGEHRLAAEGYGRVIALDPDDVESLRRRAALYGELGQPERAVQDGSRVLQREHHRSARGLTLGSVLIRVQIRRGEGYRIHDALPCLV